MESCELKELKLYAIAAACENMGIGYKGKLPWDLEREYAYFDRMTTNVDEPSPGKQNVVLMGRLTWESFPENCRPFKNRINIVLSRSSFSGPPGVLSYKSWEEAMFELRTSAQFKNIGTIWICGGTDIYKRALESSECYRLYLTRIRKQFKCDRFFPEVDQSKFKLVSDPDVTDEEQEEQGIAYMFQVFEKVTGEALVTNCQDCSIAYQKDLNETSKNTPKVEEIIRSKVTSSSKFQVG